MGDAEDSDAVRAAKIAAEAAVRAARISTHGAVRTALIAREGTLRAARLAGIAAVLTACIAGSCGVAGVGVNAYLDGDGSKPDVKAAPTESVPWWPDAGLVIGTIAVPSTPAYTEDPASGDLPPIKSFYQGDRVGIACASGVSRAPMVQVRLPATDDVVWIFGEDVQTSAAQQVPWC